MTTEPALLRDAVGTHWVATWVAFSMSLLQSLVLTQPTQNACSVHLKGALSSGETGPAPSCSLNA